mgnify:CR=1 FL=1
MRFPRPGRALLARPSAGGVPASVAGRWYRVADPALDVAEQALARVSGWLERYGVITRGAVTAEGSEGGFAAAYQVLSELEQAGKLSRGYVVDQLGGAQFATPETIDHIRTFAGTAEAGPWPSGVARPTPVLLSVLDPANPYGSVVPWPSHPTARPARAVGAVVVLADGLCLAHLSPSGRKLTVFDAGHQDHPRELSLALIGEALQQAVNEDRLGRIHIEHLDGERPGSDPGIHALLEAGGRITPRGVAFEKSRI